MAAGKNEPLEHNINIMHISHNNFEIHSKADFVTLYLAYVLWKGAIVPYLVFRKSF